MAKKKPKPMTAASKKRLAGLKQELTDASEERKVEIREEILKLMKKSGKAAGN